MEYIKNWFRGIVSSDVSIYLLEKVIAYLYVCVSILFPQTKDKNERGAVAEDPFT